MKRLILPLILYGFMASMVVNVTISSRAWHNHDRVKLHDLIQGTADKPFCYRVLWPGLVKAAVDVTPDWVKAKISSAWAETDRYNALGVANGYQPTTMAVDTSGYNPHGEPIAIYYWNDFTQVRTEYIYSLALMWLSLVGFALVMRAMLNLFFPFVNNRLLVIMGGQMAGRNSLQQLLDSRQKMMNDIAPVLFMALLPVFVSYFLYDYPNLFLFALTAYCIFRATENRYMVASLILLPLAALSKETALLLFLIFFFVIYGIKFRWRDFQYDYDMTVSWRISILLCVLLWAIATFGIRDVFKDNPGSFVEFHLWENLKHLANPLNYFRFDAFGWPTGLNILLIGTLGYLVWYGWKNKPKLLRQSLWILPCLFVLAIFMGKIDEMRMYYESLVIVFPLAYAGWVERVR